MQATTPSPSESHAAVPADLLRAAFRELHGPRLHGFALLLTLGDQSAAARLAGDALAAGTARMAELSHPERAAAWLRQRVVRQAGHLGRVAIARPDRRRAALEELGVDDAAYAGLTALGLRERAALVATTVERLDRRDVATIIGLDGTRLERLVQRARRRAMNAGASVHGERPASDGRLVTRIRAISKRTLS
jgi:DNA-directed RNA polymerase specialized sigma24 family protein